MISKATAEVMLYGEIGRGTAKEFSEELSAAGKGPVDLRINSEGGDVSEGLAMFTLANSHPQLTTTIDGIALSMASVIAQAGKRRRMSANGVFMLHNAQGEVSGDEARVRRYADTLGLVTGKIVAIYANRSGRSESEIRSLMDRETFLDAADARAAGLIDEIVGESRMAARFDPLRFKDLGPNAQDFLRSWRITKRLQRTHGVLTNLNAKTGTKT
jgi:ATP-dependent Clp endopeptidase proteolytic subunit ClpP